MNSGKWLTHLGRWVAWVQEIVYLGGRAHWRHLANTVERLWAAAVSGSAVRGGNAACSDDLLLLSFSYVGCVCVTSVSVPNTGLLLCWAAFSVWDSVHAAGGWLAVQEQIR